MSKKPSSAAVGESTETTESTLLALVVEISGFVNNGTLDSRFAAKLVKRLKKEAEAISQSGNVTKAGQKDLKKAFDTVDAALREHDAELLVTAYAALRESDDRAGAKSEKSQ